ncbi:unnamed protein product [Timema podura]|uniref:Membrane-bound transcription factor site-1 protease-like N-terminal domain-containing protein n=1 Tax=Timema podura TaxID=61482 RepID=A0ABN7NX05_TIMPD|nr:unnamed protein product [Timema podura]
MLEQLEDTKYKRPMEVSCNETMPPQMVDVQFSSYVVKNEYIVAFKDYYKTNTRQKFITAALNGSGVDKWKILPRNNPASDFPSDFDVVMLEETERLNGLSALNKHPSIRRVTPQRLVQRTLKYINVTEDCGGRNCSYNTWQSSRPLRRSSLSVKNQFWQSTGRHTSRRLLRAIPRQITQILKAETLWGMGITVGLFCRNEVNLLADAIFHHCLMNVVSADDATGSVGRGQVPLWHLRVTQAAPYHQLFHHSLSHPAE